MVLSSQYKTKPSLVHNINADLQSQLESSVERRKDGEIQENFQLSQSHEDHENANKETLDAWFDIIYYK